MARGASDAPDIAGERLPREVYGTNFADIHPPLTRERALVEANRCYFCYDAPCIEACPTGIDIPGFIKKIATDNVAGAGLRILEANIFGGSCARVCPTEVLCEGACVRTAQEGKPVNIGALQRYATDPVLAEPAHPFVRAPATGRKIAVVGGGPASLSCAHRLARYGHAVTIFEKLPRLGGLNEYGVAEYKLADRFARAEVDFVLGIGGITVATQALGRDVTLSALRHRFDAVFLGMGLAGVNALGCEGEALQGVHDAVDYIAALRQAEDLASLPVGRRIVVIGGGNTAIDIAVQTKKLGAEDVTIVYRRGAEAMGATPHEQEFAQINGVKIKHWARPVRLLGRKGHVAEAVFEYARSVGGALVGTGETFALPADMVMKAIGQVFVADPLREEGRELLELEGGRIKVDAERKTSLAKVWAGGDCVAGGEDLTVVAVEDGKVAAEAIHRALGV
ncbi:MAG TPA: NAD(P)-dependent oxidoreductase [Stellaceae bacterium]|nr:NAD(P)-dependent oxidoreductase [Stellaceae bacterium]